MKKNALFIVVILCSFVCNAQQLSWTGDAGDNDFFNEQNWIDTNTNTSPNPGTINPNISINLDLQLQNVLELIVANGIINLGTGNLSITTTNLSAEAISGGSLDIEYEGYLELSSSNPLQSNVELNLNSGIGWIRTLNLKGSEIETNHLSQIKVNQQNGTYQSNLRIDNYYLEGVVIRSGNLTTSPLTLFSNTDLEGNSADLSIDVIHTGNAIPSNLNNQTKSFILKKGFMATFAVTEDGTGKSKNYIALEEDLVINELPSYLLNDISFIRVIPWNWVNKKGRTGSDTELNNTWNYQWNNSGNSSLELEYAPMSWGYGGANDAADIELYKNKYKATHVMAFNEADNCNDQSGQYNDLCQTDVAVSIYKNLMKTGLRLVSPSCRENAPFGWLQEFQDKANQQDIRIDVIAVHWYDWGSNPTNSPNATPQSVFNRFVTYLESVHNLYGLPIWITEFNANPNRTTATNYGFMQLALPYLESLDYVERYVWYQPNSDVADYYDPSGTTLTDVGIFYRDQVSTASIPEETLLEESNLDMYYEVFGPSDNIFENGNFELGDLTSWSGSNIGILSNSNVYQGTTSGRILANAGSISQTLAVESQVTYDLSFYTKWFVAPSTAIEVKMLDASNDAVIASKLMTMSTEWNLVELSFTVPAGVNSVKFFVEKGTSPGWFIDNALLLKSTTLGLDEFDFNLLRVSPNPSSGIFILNGKTPIESYSIYDLRGRLIKSKKDLAELEIEINLAIEKKGIYFISIKDKEGNRSSKKLILK